MPNKEQEKTENVQKKSTESNPSTTKEKEDKAVEQAIATVMRDGDITHDPSRIFLDLKYEFEDSPFISEKRAEAELNKFMREYREKEDKENKAVEQVEKEDKENKAVEQVIATVMHDGDIPHDPSRIFLDLKYEFEDSPFISEKRAEAELKKFQSECRTEAELRKLKSKYKINRDDTNSLHVPTNKDRRENLKEKLNRVSKEENSSPKRAAVSQDLQHKQDNPLHR